jgi:hypothetical protein
LTTHFQYGDFFNWKIQQASHHRKEMLIPKALFLIPEIEHMHFLSLIAGTDELI